MVEFITKPLSIFKPTAPNNWLLSIKQVPLQSIAVSSIPLCVSSGK